MNVFTIATNDQSLFFLGQVFGLVGTVLPASANQPLILGIMFKAFNSVVLSVGALVVVYITVMGVMATAAEGEFLGKKWHSLWVPIRTLIGIAALVPTATGYSAIQIVMMWVIVQGIGAADFIWGTTINALQTLGSPYAGVTFPGVGVQSTMQTLFKAVSCDTAARLSYQNPLTKTASGATPGGYYCATPSGFCGSPAPFNKDATSYSFGPNGKCGTLTYCNKAAACSTPEGANSIKCIACSKQVDAIAETINSYRIIASKFVQYDYEYRDFYYNSGSGAYSAPAWIQNYCNAKGLSGPTKCCVPSVSAGAMNFFGGTTCTGSAENFKPIGGENGNPSQDAVNFIWEYGLGPDIAFTNFAQVNTNNYIGAIVGAVSSRIADMAMSSQSTGTMPKELQQAKDYGWIYAGAYYYYIAQMNNNNLTDTIPSFDIPDADPSTATDGTNPLTNLRNDYKAAGQLISAAANSAAASGGSGAKAPPILGSLASDLGSATGGIMDGWMNVLSGGGPGQLAQSPLAKIQAFGNALLITVQIIFVVVVIGTIILAILGYLSVYVLGTGINNPVGPAISTAYTIIIPLLLAFLAAFFTFGAMLGIYVPLIPYVIFTAGAIGWFIATIEAMVAAPLVALGILSPSGHHEILGKADHALMLIFGIFLRPTLMIFGLIAGMLLSAVVVTMINSGFKAVMGNLAGSSGPLQLILFMAAYVYLIVASLNKCFALIHIVPDKALRWIGGAVEQYGEGEVLGEVKSGVGGAAGTAQGAGQGASGMIKQSGDEARSRKGEGMKEAQAKKREGGPEIK